MLNNRQKTSIQRLSALIEHLTKQSRQIDELNAKHKSHWLIENNNLFSEHLFSSESDRFTPYIAEIEKRLAELSRLYSASRESFNKAEFAKSSLLHIEQQISALTNALNANQAMHQAAQISFDAKKRSRAKSAKKNTAQQSDKYTQAAQAVLLSSHQLYQQLTEHHEFERRLIAMIDERELQRQQSKANNIGQLSQEILALHQRLGRCRKAISVIERNIEQAEKTSFR